MSVSLPRFVIAKPLAGGKTGFYFNIPTRQRKRGCTIPNEPLGTSYVVACGEDGKGGRARFLNGLFDEWEAAKNGMPVESIAAPKIGTVDWLFREYKRSDAYLEKVSKRSRGDYEWAMTTFCDLLDKQGLRTGAKSIKAISPRAADKIYEKLIEGKKGKRLRTAEKLAKLARKAWKVVFRLYPAEFNKDVPNPWLELTLKSRVKGTKGAVTRDQVYQFANGCLNEGSEAAIAAAAVSVICFEWLQRPENVVAGHLKWTDFRHPTTPTLVRIVHHKTGAKVLHPLEEELPDGSVVKFYEDAEAVLAHLPRSGIPMILREVDDGKHKPYAMSGMQKIIQRMRVKLKMSAAFTLDACRHGGMTELEEAELTDGQGRALSGHKTQQSYEGYAKRNLPRALSATRKRHAHRLANASETNRQNTADCARQNENSSEVKSA